MPSQKEKQIITPPHEQSASSTNNLLQQLAQHGYTHQELNVVLHKFMLHHLQSKKQTPYNRLKHYATNTISKIIHYTKTLSGKALCLLHTQFAKKPKNPV